MAAGQVTGRRCPDCGSDISHRNAWAKRCVACSEERQEAQRRAGNERKRAGQKRTAASRKALSPRAHLVKEQYEDAKNRRQRICGACQGMPWARTNDRIEIVRGGQEKAVGNPCRECGGLWAPEPAVERVSTIRSSAGMCLRVAAGNGLTDGRR